MGVTEVGDDVGEFDGCSGLGDNEGISDVGKSVGSSELGNVVGKSEVGNKVGEVDGLWIGVIVGIAVLGDST